MDRAMLENQEIGSRWYSIISHPY